jgi:hypothetical protein
MPWPPSSLRSADAGRATTTASTKVNAKLLSKLPSMLPLALRFIGACPRQVAQHDAGDTVCAPLVRARRTEVAETRVFMAMRMGVLMDNSPTASWWVVMIAGARFHARTSQRASQDASRASRPGRTSPTKSLQRLSVHLSKLPFLSRLAGYLFDFAVRAPRQDPSQL